MATPSRTIRTLRRYGARSAKNKAKLEKWRDDAIEDLADNKGADVAGGSSNGASFSFMVNMTIAEWLDALDEALEMMEKNIKSTSTAYGRVC